MVTARFASMYEHAARHAQVVFEHDEAAVLETHQVGAGDRHVDVAVDADAAHFAPVVPAAVHQLARHDALGEDASLVVDVLEKEVDRDQPLRQAALQRVPLARRDDARQQIEREDPLGALLVAVDREGDALRQEGAVGLDLPAAEIVERHGRQLVERAPDSAAARAPARRTSRRTRDRVRNCPNRPCPNRPCPNRPATD